MIAPKFLILVCISFIFSIDLANAEQNKILKKDTDKFEMGDKIEFLKDGPTLMADYQGWINNDEFRACALIIGDYKQNEYIVAQPVRILSKTKDKKSNRVFTVKSAELELLANGQVNTSSGKKGYIPMLHYKLSDTNEVFTEILCRLDGPPLELSDAELAEEKKKLDKYLDVVGMVRKIFKGQSLSIYKEVTVVPENPIPAVPKSKDPPVEHAPKPKPRIDL